MQHDTPVEESVNSKQHRLEDGERRDELVAYFDLAWEIFVRLEREGKLGISSLTTPEVNHTVKPQIPSPQDQSNESA
jgi:hypothetical protein